MTWHDVSIIDRALALELDVQVGGSRMETVSGKDGNPYFDLTFTLNGAELACKAANLPLGKHFENGTTVTNE